MAPISRFARASALLAAASMAAAPAAAVELPPSPAHASHSVATGWDSDAQNADNHRRYRYRRHRGGVDAGDVLAGVLILGGIAAVAGAASRDARDRDDRYRGGPYRYRPYGGDSGYADARGIDRAVGLCVREIERDVRVGSVDTVDREADGWRVTGALYDGQGFSCRVGDDGRIDDVDYGARGGWSGAAAAGDRQWDDERYAEAWRERDARAADAPAYPGGPVGDDAVDEGAADGRYSTSQAPDFGV